MNNFDHTIRPEELTLIAGHVLATSRIDRDFALSMIYGSPERPVPNVNYKATTDVYRAYMLAIGVDELLWERELDMAMRRSAEWDRAILLCAIAAAKEGRPEALDQVIESFQRQVRYAAT